MGQRQSGSAHFLRPWTRAGLLGCVIATCLAGCGISPGATGADQASPVAGEGATLSSSASGAGRLFTVPAASMGAEVGADPVPVTIHRHAALDAARHGTLLVELPDGTRFPVRHERSGSAPGGNWTFVGRVDTPHGPMAAVLTFGRDAVFGTLPTPDGDLLQLTTIRGRTALVRAGGIVPAGLDPDQVSTDIVALPPPAQRSGRGLEAPSQGARLVAPSARVAAIAATDPVTITVLGIYTTNLVDKRGSVAAAETEFTHLVAVTNQAHVDSGTSARFELAGFAQTGYSPGATNHQAIASLAANTLPGLDVAKLRDEAGADLVAMLRPYVPGDTTCGIANLVGADLSPYDLPREAGYSVTNADPCGPFTLAHELGHNLGSTHDIETETRADGSVGYGAFPFSFGYRQHNPSFHTIMAYVSGAQAQVGRFSDPRRQDCLGVRCGIEGEADNVRSINLMAAPVSRLRDPPGTITVLDAQAYEPDAGGNDAFLRFKVRLASPAPAGGIGFDIATVEGGTAQAGVDYEPTAATAMEIPAGERETTFDVRILPDTLVEGTETVHVRLSNVTGAAAAFMESAVGRVLDDDPRPRISGRLVFPRETQPPSWAYIYVETWVGSQWTTPFREWQGIPVTPPDFHYEVPVLPGAAVRVEVNVPEPFASRVHDLGIVSQDLARDLVVDRAVRLSGRVRWPADMAAPTTPFSLGVWGASGSNIGTVLTVSPPDFDYAIDVVPGHPIALDARPPAPYAAQRLELGPLAADRNQDLTLRTTPSLSVDHVLAHEGGADAPGIVILGIRLSEPAPVGGVKFDLVSMDGSARSSGARPDFVPFAKALHISQNNNYLEVPIALVGDDIPERNEAFAVVASNVVGGYWVPADGGVTIIDDDGPVAVRSDLDGDGRSDLLWRNMQTGGNAYWSAGDHLSSVPLATVRDTRWTVAGVADFDGDTASDLLWRHRQWGSNSIWRAGLHQHAIDVRPVAVEWAVAGVADFDGDARADLLWRNGTTGANTVWRGGDYLATLAVPAVSVQWFVAGVGDFDGDGRSDVLWRNRATGANNVWPGAALQGAYAIARVPDRAWSVAGVGDFDGDGVDDLVWRHGATGANSLWYSGNAATSVPLARVPDMAWRIAAIGDYDGDGKADLVWRHDASGRNVVWPTGDAASSRAFATVRGGGWEVVPRLL